MDRSLDEIASQRLTAKGPRGPRRDGRRNDRNDYPRDGVRKPIRDDSRDVEPRDMDSEWVHDRYNNDSSPYRPTRARRASPPRQRERAFGGPSSKLRVENIHYDLTQRDLIDLFNRIGPVERLELLYDRAGRSEGVAYVTYESVDDAHTAIAEFDGANANGQPIRLSIANSAPPRRNPFDTAVRPGRSLEDRITRPGDSRNRSYSPHRPSDVSGPAPPGVDRYVPGPRSSRSPMPRRREGRPPGARRERGDRADSGRGRETGARPGRRPKKTQEELDAEMDDYWGSVKANGDGDAAGGNQPTESAAPAVSAVDIAGDIDMIE